MTPPGLQMIERAVRRTLRFEIAPVLVTYKNLKPPWWGAVYQTYLYAGDLAAAAIGVGIAPPILQVMANQKASLSGTPAVFVAMALAWIVAKTIFARTEASKKVNNYLSCFSAFQTAEDRVYRAMRRPNPASELSKLALQIEGLYDLHRESGAFAISAYDPTFGKDAEKMTEHLIVSNRDAWSEGAAPQQQEVLGKLSEMGGDGK